MNKNELADKIRILRKQKGLRQEDLAGKAGVSIRVIKDLESASGNPTIESLSLVSSVLGISLSQILMPGMELINPNVIQAPRPVGSNSSNDKNEKTNARIPVGTIGQPSPDTQGNENSRSKSGSPPHKMSKKIDNLSHDPSSDSNQNNFSDRATLILEIQDLIKNLSQDNLEAIKASAENLVELSQKSKTSRDKKS